MKMRLGMLLVFTFLISGHLVAQDSQAEKANEQIIVCQYKAAIEIDDGISDAKTLAPVIADRCKAESNRFYSILRSKIKGPMDENRTRRAARERDLDMAAKVLLMKRSDERKARGG